MKINFLLFLFSFALLISACQEKAADKPKDSVLETNTDITLGQQDPGQTLQIEPQQQTTVQPGQQTTAQPGQKLNPPHGQPGHDCKVPVGSPLPAGSGTSTTQAAKTQVQQPSVTLPQQMSGQPNVSQPVQMPAQKSVAKPGEKLNPPHGQPGHDCKIPVGSPLK